MELCMEARALKSSLRRELAVKSTQHALMEEVWCDTAISGVPSDEFSVDDLLDFSNGEFEDGSVEEEQELEEHEEDVEEDKDSVSVDSVENSNSSYVTTESTLAGQLVVPDDDIAELEWVSHFVDDSVLELSLLHPVSKVKPETLTEKNRSEPEARYSNLSWLPSQVPVKARSKRFRPASRCRSLWNPLGDSPSTLTSCLSSPSSTSSCSSGISLSTPYLVLTNPVHNVAAFWEEPAAKKIKRKPAVQIGDEVVVVGIQRRCTHCQVQKTPQWRTGPLGPKTLCNACGVRYKSGRLFPEYRPACSPTFSGDVHSNSHRKVLEMRRIKDNGEPEPGTRQMILGF
ncbi:GATA transcription factor 5-like [Argentina anserina]|uniref:GATA transcription factor 5-like n=1 Tax=Argentina anserina TaxID=57926 RepID=UPI0021767E69|nr:GATA transcription factor 5-like [Potentilla anserina]XP_050364513.1 GATA transcription factor 5-like [Potentilla anserina]